MSSALFPKVNIRKKAIPTIYFDTCAMIELCKCEKGNCKDTHAKDFERLLNVLEKLKQQQRVLCPLGNQLKEMGMTPNRTGAKDFLYRFTNSELFTPEMLERTERELSYRAYINAEPTIEFDYKIAFENNTPVTVHVSEVYTKEQAAKAKEIKMFRPAILNEMKSKHQIEEDFDSQLEVELSADFIQYANLCFHESDSIEGSLRFADMRKMISALTGTHATASGQDWLLAESRYVSYTMSKYHHNTPYIWIEASLWAHIMQRSGNVEKGDNLDVTWAAAYLPFVHYAVTDNAFCNLLVKSGLADKYNTKVYSFRTLSYLVDELEAL